MDIQNNTFSIILLEWLNKIITIELFIKIVILYFLIVWVYIIFWVISDSLERSNSIIFQLFSIFLITIWTPFWIFIYLLIRPTKTLLEKYCDQIDNRFKKLKNLIKISEKIKKKDISIRKIP